MTNTIPFHDFGGEGPLLHFAHPNGYTPATFRQMIEPLLPHFRVIAVCHRPLWPGSRPEEVDSWQVVADDMIRFLEQVGARNIIGIGHSLGAVATMYVALAQPQLLRCLVFIEPIFLPPSILQMVAADPAAMDNFPLVRNTYNRRRRWHSRQAAFDHFRPKDVFRYWSDEAIWDYVNHSLHESETGDVVLTYSREWEAHFYKLPPLDVWELIPTIPQPTLAIRGAGSDALFPEAWQLWQELQPRATFVEIPDAAHMTPMERPLLVAETILNFLQTPAYDYLPPLK